MPLSEIVAPYIDAMVERLRQIVPRLEENAPFFGQLHYHLGWANADYTPVEMPSGKRIRPVFCLMACEVYAGSYQPALSAAAAIELLHEFSLVHDDIEDGDRMRRHRPTLWTVVGPAQAINAGDGLFALAQLAMLKSTELGGAPGTVLNAVQRFNETALALCIGQFQDMSFESRSTVTPESYIEMIRGKTAALLGFSGEVGALLGGADASACRRFYELGESIGLAFQMRDDLLGIWGDPEATGKPVGADIRAKKKSLPVAFALSMDEDGELRALYQQPLNSDAQVDRARALIEATGAYEQVSRLAGRFEERALELLESLPFPAERLLPLRQLADALAQRTH